MNNWSLEMMMKIIQCIRNINGNIQYLREIFYFESCFIFLEDYMNYDISLFDLEHA